MSPIALLASLLLTLDGGASPAPDAGPPSVDGGRTGAGNLLRRATITRKDAAPDALRMADGVAPTDGDNWNTPHTAVLASRGEVVWDLGLVRPIAAARIQADNNDTYLLNASADGVTWSPVWTAKPVDIPGMQTRSSEPLAASARYLRLTAEGGDSMYSVGELEVFETVEELVGAQLQRIPLPPIAKPAPPPPFDTAFLVVFGLALYAGYLLHQARLRNRAAKAAAAAPEKKADPPSGAT